MLQTQTLKGFRDFLPPEARKRQYVIEKLKKTFETYGFEPLETPALEYEATLMGKYGEEGDKLMYRFEDNGKRRVALRYDQTVPTARVAAQYQNTLSFPFKRYQIQPVWRAENTQKGRFREFMQCDVDSIGSQSLLADAEVISTAAAGMRSLGFTSFTVLINDRGIFQELVSEKLLTEEQLIPVVRIIDKLEKIGRQNVLNEITALGIAASLSEKILCFLEQKKPSEAFAHLFTYLAQLDGETSTYQFTPTLARGLDYYTSTIFEIIINGYTAGSVCGGGRYDNLIGMFAGKKIPATGFAFGFDRIVEAMDELHLFPLHLTSAKVLVTTFSENLQDISIKTAKKLRDEQIATDMYLDANTKMDKQIKYALQKNIPYVIIIGPEENQKGTLQLKNLKDRTQQEMTIAELPAILKK